MLRRRPEAILVAHRMDQGRRELYVEGVGDRVFLKWLAGEGLHDRTLIVPIEMVEISDVDEGGNRQRLIEFLRLVEREPHEIRGLLDADDADYVGETLPSNAWRTDLRDIEGYVLAEENVETALRLGCRVERGSAGLLLLETQRIAQRLAAVRLVSRRLGLRLPVSNTKLSKFVSVSDDGSLILNENELISTLLHRAGISRRQTSTIVELIPTALGEIQGKPPEFSVQGKDCMKLLTLQFKALGATDNIGGDVTPLLWSTFRREKLGEFPVLAEVVRYLLGP